MSHHFPVLNYKDLIKLALQKGFVFYRQSKGSHEIWKRLTDNRRTTLVNHGSKPLKRKTTKAILADLEIDWKELVE